MNYELRKLLDRYNIAVDRINEGADGAKIEALKTELMEIVEACRSYNTNRRDENEIMICILKLAIAHYGFIKNQTEIEPVKESITISIKGIENENQ